MLILDDLKWDDWTLPRATAEALLKRLDERQPKLIVECGSGNSTVLLNDWAARNDAKVISLEHEMEYFTRTWRALEARDLDTDGLRFCPLEETSDDHFSYVWYGAKMEGLLRSLYDGARADFVLVDGPPGTVGRYGAMPALWPLLAEKWELWLDDYQRTHEQQVLDAWSAYYGGDKRSLTVGRGVGILSSS